MIIITFQYATLKANRSFWAFRARGIVAEPLAKRQRREASDGADSPTRAHEVREAARPINFASQNLN